MFINRTCLLATALTLVMLAATTAAQTALSGVLPY